MLNRKRRGIEAGILLAVTVWAACQTEEAARAAVNITSSDAFAFGMVIQDMLVHDTAQTAVLEAKAAARDDEEAAKETAAREAENEPEGGFHVTYQGDEAERFIELRHCDCVYDTDDIQIYAEYLYSNITVELTEVCTDGAGLLETEAGENDAGILKGEIGGIEKATGQRYYADWEVDMADGALSAALCVLRQYDPVKDKETFADCDRIFDQIEQGDWSDVNPVEEPYLWGMDAEEWLRMDVNGDGMPELVGGWVIEELPDYVDSRKIEISVIFAYQDGMAKMVYLDVNDGMEFLFITADGELVYEWGVSGGPATSVFRRCTFDLKWNREYLDTLVRYRFPEELEEEETFEGEREYYREHYPDTYGVGGSGVYCLRERPKTEEELKHNDDGQYTVREYLTEEEFLKLYEEWTGWDFYKAANVH